MQFLSWRSMFLFAFVVAMPILALPPVARRVDELLYGAPPANFGRPPSPPPTNEHVPAAKPDGPLAQARYDEPSPATGLAQPASYTMIDSPPLLAPALPFEPIVPPAAAAAATESSVDNQQIAQLHGIRERLEELGADYVVVEVLDGPRYRFFCRMLVDERSRFTKPFEASAFDPVAAGREVLQNVEAWRAAGRRMPLAP
jgi:hypothetical protein